MKQFKVTVNFNYAYAPTPIQSIGVKRLTLSPGHMLLWLSPPLHRPATVLLVFLVVFSLQLAICFYQGSFRFHSMSKPSALPLVNDLQQCVEPEETIPAVSMFMQRDLSLSNGHCCYVTARHNRRVAKERRETGRPCGKVGGPEHAVEGVL